jgi:hypothetical protein
MAAAERGRRRIGAAGISKYRSCAESKNGRENGNAKGFSHRVFFLLASMDADRDYPGSGIAIPTKISRLGEPKVARK